MEINYAPLSTDDIIIAVTAKKVAQYKWFKGVFAADMLPMTFQKPAIFIVNTDTKDKPGEHWISIYFSNGGVCEYFDSFGMPPIVCEHIKFIKEHANKLLYNPMSIQSLDTSVCGQYCVMFACHKLKNKTFQSFLNLFDKKNSYNNDAVVIIMYMRVNNYSKSRNHKTTCKQNMICVSRCLCK